MKKTFFSALSLLLLFQVNSFGQRKEEELIQFSGLVLTSDSLVGIPYVTIIIENKGRGTMTNYQGFFSLVVAKGDVITFGCIGFKSEKYTIPSNLSQTKYSIVQLMTDTVYELVGTHIFPWPNSYDEFKQKFLELHIPDDDLERARRNLERERLREIGLSMSNDANESVDYYMRSEAQKFYYAGQIPPSRIFDPTAWAQFINSWKKGEFKKAQEQSTKKPQSKDLPATYPQE